MSPLRNHPEAPRDSLRGPSAIDGPPAIGGPSAIAGRQRALVACFGLLTLVAWLAGAGCVPHAARFDERALAAGLVRTTLPGTIFEHALFSSRALRTRDGAPARRLHLYIEGDGSPREAARFRPPDPTSRGGVALDLMRLDPAPSVLLGRPCQHAVEVCDPRFWTVARYSEEIVASMTAVARRVIASRNADESTRIVLVGWSGGGTLAWLMAERLESVSAVVTVAGNLDVAAWTAHHGFHPLTESLDPAARPPLDPRVLQLHALGGRDSVVPPALVRAVIARQPGARTEWVAAASHGSGWTAAWPAVLADLDRWLQDAASDYLIGR